VQQNWRRLSPTIRWAFAEVKWDLQLLRLSNCFKQSNVCTFKTKWNSESEDSNRFEPRSQKGASCWFHPQNDRIDKLVLPLISLGQTFGFDWRLPALDTNNNVGGRLILIWYSDTGDIGYRTAWWPLVPPPAHRARVSDLSQQGRRLPDGIK